MSVLMPQTNGSSSTPFVYLFGWEIFFDTTEHYNELRRAIKDYPNFGDRDWAFEVDGVVVSVGDYGAAAGVVGDFDASPEFVQRLFNAVKCLMAKAGYVPKKIIKGSGVRGFGHLFVEDDKWVVYPPAFIVFHRGDTRLLLPVTAVRWGDSPFPDES